MEQSLRGLWGAAQRGLRALGGLLRTCTWLPPRQARHGVLLLHLQVVLVLESLLESLLLGCGAGVTLTLLGLLGAVRGACGGALTHRRGLHAGLAHVALPLRGLRLLELSRVHLLLLQVSPHQQLPELRTVQVPHLGPRTLQAPGPPPLLLLLLLKSCNLLLL